MTSSSWLPLGTGHPVAPMLHSRSLCGAGAWRRRRRPQSIRGPFRRHGSRAARVKSQYSSKDSPLKAKTLTPAWAIAAAAWSWVLKMLQLAQRTEAPSSTSVSIRTAVSMVMCNDPETRTPLKRLLRAVFLAHGHQAGHLLLRDRDFFAAPVGQGDVTDLVVFPSRSLLAFALCQCCHSSVFRLDGFVRFRRGASLSRFSPRRPLFSASPGQRPARRRLPL